MSEKLIGVIGISFVGTLAGQALSTKMNIPIELDAEFVLPDSPMDDPVYPNVARYYVSPTGSNQSAGTYKHPFKTWEYAASKAVPGDLIYIRGGVYYSDASPVTWDAVHIENSGVSGEYIRMYAYPGETPILDCSAMILRNYISGFNLKGNYWHVKGLTVTGVPQFPDIPYLSVAFAIKGKHNIFELCTARDNMGMGFGISGDHDDNLILNCDSYRNADLYSGQPTGAGSNADGFHVYPNTLLTAVTTFRGCRSWENSDDGFDFYGAESIIKVENCVSFRNGYHPGTWDHYADGEGFKLGHTVTVDDVFRRIVTGCVAFRNYGHGFDKATTLRHKMINNTVYNNGFGNFSLNGVAIDVLSNNIALRDNGYSGSDFSPNAIDTNNSWDLTPPQLPVNHFKSLDWTGIDGPRLPDGDIPIIDFLRLKDTSAFKTASMGAYY